MRSKEEYREMFSKPDWDIETLEAADEVIGKIAKEYLELDTYPNQFEIVTSEQLLDVMSSIGLPTNYPHWRFGKDFMTNQGRYKRGQMGLSYEMVINSNPCISYNLESNTLCMMLLVIAHACQGHNSFFKNNYMFKQWTDADGIVDYMVFARDYILKCEEKYGPEEVEWFLDACHTIQRYGVDKYVHPTKLSSEKEKERLQKALKWDDENYNDLWKTIPKKFVTEQSKGKRDTDKLDEPQENILYFIEKNSPNLPQWKRELIRIVRKVAQYFFPQSQCLVGNTYVVTENGFERIGELITEEGYNEKVINVLSDNNKYEKTSHFYKKLTNKTIRIKTKLGKTIECTPEHPLMTINRDLSIDMKEAQNFNVGDYIVNKVGYNKAFNKSEFVIDFKFPEKRKSVTCGVCGEDYKSLSTHIPKHGLTVEEYKDGYSNEIICESVLYGRSGDVKIPETLNGNIARLLGYFVSEGSWVSHSFSVSNKDKDIIDDVINTLKVEFNIDGVVQYMSDREIYTVSTHNGKFFDILKYIGVNNVTSYYKSVPHSIMKSSEGVVKDFLRAIFEGDGTNTTDGVINYSSRSKQLCEQIQLLLQHIGVMSKVVEQEINYDYRMDVPHTKNYKTIILGYHYNEFLEKVGFLSDRKNVNNKKYGNNVCIGTCGVPYLSEYINEIRTTICGSTSKNKVLRRESLPQSRSTQEFKWTEIDRQKEEFKYIRKVDEESYHIIKNVITKENYYDEIISIELVEEDKYVYDFTIPSNHLFMSDGYISHNTKVTNEGWATFSHYMIINKMYDEGYLDDGFMLEFFKSHSAVIFQPDYNSKYFSGINPYTLGFNIFMDIKRICEDPTEEDKEWFPNLIEKDWLEEVTFAMENFRDDSFILQYLSPKVMRDMKLFTILDSEGDDHYEVTSIHDKVGYKKVREALSKQYNRGFHIPNIQVTAVDTFLDRTLTLTHFVSNDMRVKEEVQKEVIDYIEELWGFPVVFEEVNN